MKEIFSVGTPSQVSICHWTLIFISVELSPFLVTYFDSSNKSNPKNFILSSLYQFIKKEQELRQIELTNSYSE